jgi:hypothetical protein
MATKALMGPSRLRRNWPPVRLRANTGTATIPERSELLSTAPTNTDFSQPGMSKAGQNLKLFLILTFNFSEGITVAPPTLVDETTNKNRGQIEDYDDFQNVPVQRPQQVSFHFATVKKRIFIFISPFRSLAQRFSNKPSTTMRTLTCSLDSLSLNSHSHNNQGPSSSFPSQNSFQHLSQLPLQFLSESKFQMPSQSNLFSPPTSVQLAQIQPTI